MRKLLIIPFISLCLGGFAQQFTWVKSAGSYDTDKGMRCIEDNQGNLLFVGSFTDSMRLDPSTKLLSKGKTDFYLQKTNSQGEILWAINGGGGKTKTSEATAVDVDADNNIYIGGYFKDTLIIGDTEVHGYIETTASNDCFVAKFSSAGALVWLKTFIGPLSDQIDDLNVFGSAIYAVGRYKDVLTIGGTELKSQDSNTGTADNPFVAALNLSGDLIWADKVDCFSGFGRCIEVSPDGKVNVAFELKSDYSPILYTAGTAYSKALKSSTGTSDDYIVRLNPETGAVLWSNRISSSGSDMCYALTSDLQSNVYIGGIFQNTVTLESTVTGTSASSTSAGSFDIFLGKYDTNGQLLWSTFVGTDKSDNVLDLAVNSNNHLYMAGYTLASSITLADSTYTAPAATINGILVRYSPEGAITWADMASSTSGSFYINSLAITANNNVILNGYFKGEGTFFDDTNLPNEFTTSNIVYARLSDPTVWANYTTNDDVTLTVYPNPANKVLNFIAANSASVSRIRVFNLVGQELLDVKPTSSSINISDLSAGIYLVQFDVDNITVTKKIIVRGE